MTDYMELYESLGSERGEILARGTYEEVMQQLNDVGPEVLRWIKESLSDYYGGNV